MTIWAGEINELEKLYGSFKGQLPDIAKELEQLIRTDDPNVVMLYSRRCLEVIVTDLCECELKRPRKTEPLKGIIDKLNSEEKVPSHIITSMHSLNSLATYGTHPKDFDPEQVKPVLNNLAVILRWYLKYKETQSKGKVPPDTQKELDRTSTQAKGKTWNKTKKILIYSLAFLIVVAAVLVIIKFNASDRKLEKSIAVLPFKLLSDELDKQYLADGVMDAILLHLQKFTDLRVISRTSVEQYRGTTKTTHVIGQELDVEYLLEGSFQKSGDNVNLIVRLIKVREGRQHWGKEYNRNWKNIFYVQSEIAQAIAGELHTVITPEEKQLIEKIPTTNLTAYDLYLKANDYQNEYEKTRDLSSYQKAVTFYEAAIEIDSAFAKAYAGLARAYYNRYFYESYFKENFLDSCHVLVNIALSFDDQLDEAYYIKGQYYRANGHIEEALDNYDKALIINPNYYLAYYNKGFVLTWVVHDFVKGIDNYHKALMLVHGEERPSLLRALGRAYLDVGFIEKAKYYYQEALALDSNKVIYVSSLAFAEFSLEHFENALNLLKQEYEIDSTMLPDLMFYSVPPGHNEEAYINATKMVEHYKNSGKLNLAQSHRVGYAFYQVGKFNEAENYLNQQIKYSEESIKLDRVIAHRMLAHYDLAATYAFLGDKVKAYQYLDDFDTMNFYQLWWISLAKHDPLFASIRNEERFQKILQNMEAKYQKEHERVRKWIEEQGIL